MAPLPGGHVLIMGGWPDGRAAARYDPVADRWTPVAPLTAVRRMPQATALPDGQVLVTGGIGDQCGKICNALATAERYNPATNTWTPVAPMTRAWYSHSALLLPNGRVLVFGDFGQTTTAEVYDPASDRWLPTGPRTAVDGRATLLPDGRVLVVAQKAVEFYDPATNGWTAVAPKGTEGGFPVTLQDGRALAVGGFYNSGSKPRIATAEVFADERVVPGMCFAETGRCVRGPFLDHWQRSGGLAVNGFPLSDVRLEPLEDRSASGGYRAFQVQYFERTRLEYHPENAAPYNVQLGQFGRRIHPADPPVDARPDAAYFPETGHNVTVRFMAYWEANGGLAQFGYPISEEFRETLEDGNEYVVQYFERARFELHPENAPPYDVLLGQFGRRILKEIDGLDPGFALTLTTNPTVRERLGPRTGDAARPAGATQRFERGRMLYRADTRMIYVLCEFPESNILRLGRWFSIADTWAEGQEIGGGVGPREDLYVPKRGFGKVWRENAELRDCLGYATSADETAVTLLVQPFTGGLMLTGATEEDRRRLSEIFGVWPLNVLFAETDTGGRYEHYQYVIP